MPVRKYKPTSAGRRFMSVSTFDEVTKMEPEKSLTEPLTKKAGRNVYGRVTTRHRGGGHKRRYRVIDFKRRKDGVWATVAAIEYDPNRSPRIALLQYDDGEKSYILAPEISRRATRSSAVRKWSRAWATVCRCGASPWACRSIIWKCNPAEAGSYAAAPERRRRSPPAKAIGRRSRCRPAKCAASAPSAGPLSAFSAMRTI